MTVVVNFHRVVKLVNVWQYFTPDTSDVER